MKVFLMHRDRDFDPEAPPPTNAGDLTQDLALDALLGAMAGGDELLYAVSQRALLQSLTDPADIVYRQEVLRDCLEHYAVVREMYDVTVATLIETRKLWRGMSPSSVLGGAVSAVGMFLTALRRLRALSDEHAGEFTSPGFRQFFAMIAGELDDAYLAELDDHQARLRFRDGVLMSARLGDGNKGTGYVLRRLPEAKRRWFRRVPPRSREALSFQIADRDESGARALGELRSRGIALVANALAQSEDHIASFLRMLRTELAFYLACVNLHARLADKGEPLCFPAPAPAGDGPVLSAHGLYDVSLSLSQPERMVGNDLAADGKALVMITGANQGGKSTFLRSLGLAHLMMQAGMFVPAAAFRANVCTSVFTHHKREEDVTMRSGKLDEELSRMSAIAAAVSPGALVLFNESFAATNEHEGSEIARHVIRALLEAGVKVVFVTHLYDLAHSLFARRLGTALFLRAERRPDGQRTFRVVEGEPLPTSHGEDVYRRVFEAPSPALAAATG